MGHCASFCFVFFFLDNEMDTRQSEATQKHDDFNLGYDERLKTGSCWPSRPARPGQINKMNDVAAEETSEAINSRSLVFTEAPHLVHACISAFPVLNEQDVAQRLEFVNICQLELSTKVSASLHFYHHQREFRCFYFLDALEIRPSSLLFFVFS